MKHETEETAVTDTDRRLLLKATAAGIGAALMAAPLASAQEQAGSVQVRGEAFAQTHQPKPLPFNSASLNGLSQRLIDSHWSNNYGGSVRALNETKKPARRRARRSRFASLHLQRPEARAPHAHRLGRAARALLRQPRRQRPRGCRGAKSGSRPRSESSTAGRPSFAASRTVSAAARAG